MGKSKRTSKVGVLQTVTGYLQQELQESLVSATASSAADEESESIRIFERLHVSNSNVVNAVGTTEIAEFVASKSELWSMLSESSANLSKQRCQAIATMVAMQLASGVEGPEAIVQDLTREQFHHFRKTYMLDPEGSREFFHRCMFAAFDEDGNAYLDDAELEELLEALYSDDYSDENSVPDLFRKRDQLPPRDALKQILQLSSEAGQPTFREIWMIINDTETVGNNSSSIRGDSSSNLRGIEQPQPPNQPKERSASPQPRNLLQTLFQSSGNNDSGSIRPTNRVSMMSKIGRYIDKEKAESAKLFDSLDVDNSNSVCNKEISNYVASKAELWAMLSVNLSLSEERCQEIATRVAMELATNIQGSQALNEEITQKQFHDFRTAYVLNPQGSQEFFHRCVFAAFDADGNAYLDEKELDDLLDVFYVEGSIFQGDARLPPKKELKQIIHEKYTANREKRLSFHEVRGLISGTATRDDFLKL